MADENQNDEVDAQDDDENQMEDFIDQIKIACKSFADLGKQISERLRPVMIEMEEARKRMALAIKPALQQASVAWNSFMKTASLALERLSEQAKIWQEQRKQDVVVMAESGWFPNMLTFDYEPEIEVNDIDVLMTMHLNDDWTELTENIIELCPERKHILETAFGLHKEGNYIASIPLFISQADGIFCEEIKTFLFANNRPDEQPIFREETEQYIEKLIEDGKFQKGFVKDIFLEPYKVESQFGKGVSKSGPKAKKEAPNRSGILHGHRKHLDYGTELNSLKSLSLLAFVVVSTKVIFRKTQPTDEVK